MRRFVFGLCVLVASATATFAIARYAMSPPAPPPAKQRVLYIERGDGTLRSALAGEYAVTRSTPAEMPTDLAGYDVVVMSDVPADLLDATHVAALDAYARGGGSLLIAGGIDSFGSGGYEATPLEHMMPVRFGSGCRLDQPELALVIVANDALAIPTVLFEEISPNDYVAVVGLDRDSAHLRVRPQRAANRKRIADQVAWRAPAADRGNLTVGLRKAYEILENIHAKQKHVIVVEGAHDTSVSAADVLAEMRDHGITATVGHTLPVDLQQAVPTEDDDERVRVRAETPELDVAGAPPLYGYVSMRTKPDAQVLVATAIGEPLLARWRYGAGTVTVWTSDLDQTWSRDWIHWSGYTGFWSRALHPK